MNRADIHDILNEMKDRVGGAEALYSFYGNYCDLLLKTTEHMHRLHTGVGFNLYKRMKQAGADDDELLRGARYTLAAIDCMKLHLNIKQIGKDLGINDLKKKYPPTNGTTEHD